MAASYAKMEVKKQEYHAVAGTSYPQPRIPDKVVVSQPSAVTGVETYILNLDASQVAGWSVQDVINQFVEKIGCGYAAELFVANRINGKSLMLLREDHLKEMGVQAIGDRVYMLDMIALLKKKKIEMATTATLWSGEMPAPGCAYSKNFGQCCRRYLCPCCTSRTYWKVTGQGVFYRKVPPCRQYFGTSCENLTEECDVQEKIIRGSMPGNIATEYMDYRFFKDLELKEEHLCCCFCRRYRLELYVDDKDSKGAERSEAASGFPTPHELIHPEAPRVEQIIRNAWGAAKLVAD